jgi:glycosyltransferase involved in cell wall biosynthesis
MRQHVSIGANIQILISAAKKAVKRFCSSRSCLFQKEQKIIEIKPIGAPRGCVVISYIITPFVEGVLSPSTRGHTNAGEVYEMAMAYRALGFRVEVCNWDDTLYSPPRDAIVAIDIHSNLERWKLPKDCIKVLHATGAHWSFQNKAESMRLEGVRKRSGVALVPRRSAASSRAAECADHIVVLGNEFTTETFGFTGKTITRVPISSAYEFPFPERRDYEKARERFLWVGSYGMVHKGLDLVLEAFAGMPELELTVCGRPEKEEDFFQLYERELKHTPNIHFQGWIDMSSPEFLDIVGTHAAVVYPSCSEGGGGSVIHCMHAGMIPICTREASVDLNDFGVLIRDGSVSAVQEAVRKIASMNVSEVERRARASWSHVRAVHSREHFAKNYAVFASSLIS